MKVLLAGWSSVLHGEATAGDVLAVRAVERHLRAGGHDVACAWSEVVFPACSGPSDQRYDDVDPRGVDVAVWVCGPLTGDPVREFHARFADCRRVAVGVSVLDPSDPAVAGFHAVVPRDAHGVVPQRDLAGRPPVAPTSTPTLVPVVGVFLTHGQGEYAGRRRHEEVSAALAAWLGGLDAATLELETRVDPRDWRLPSRPEEVLAVVARLDVVVSTRLHGLVLALRSGVPCLAVDPVAGGGKVGAQARAWGWPVLAPEELGPAALDERFAWCRSRAGRDAARAAHEVAASAGEGQLASLDSVLAR